MKLGVYGGTFDPIHIGHLIIADRVREILGLDKILFVPCANPPHKNNRNITPAVHRLHMLRLAIAGNACFEISEMEIERGGISYTVDTLEQLASQHAYKRAEIFYIIGADSLAEMTSWRNPERIFELCQVVVVNRPQAAPQVEFSDFRSKAIRLNTPLLDISSSELRRRAGDGKSIRHLVTREVEEYIVKNRLYLPAR